MEISGFPRGGVHVSKRGVRVGAPLKIGRGKVSIEKGEGP